MTVTSARPLPVPSDLTLPYWQAAADHRLALQKCDSCGRFVHPPRAECPECTSKRLSFTDVSGRGTIEAFTVVHRTFARGFAERVPYVVAWVELDEQQGTRILCNVPIACADTLAIGTTVEVSFDELADFGPIPQFRPAHPPVDSNPTESR